MSARLRATPSQCSSQRRAQTRKILQMGLIRREFDDGLVKELCGARFKVAAKGDLNCAPLHG